MTESATGCCSQKHNFGVVLRAKPSGKTKSQMEKAVLRSSNKPQCQKAEGSDRNKEQNQAAKPKKSTGRNTKLFPAPKETKKWQKNL